MQQLPGINQGERLLNKIHKLIIFYSRPNLTLRISDIYCSELQLPDIKGEHDSRLQTVTQNFEKNPRTGRKFKNSSGLGGVYLEIITGVIRISLPCPLNFASVFGCFFPSI